VVNKIDGYEFKVPREWDGLKSIEYFPKTTEGQYQVASINVVGIQGSSRFIAVDKFILEEGKDFDTTVQKILEGNGLVSELKKESLENFEVIKTQGVQGLGGLNITFFRTKNYIYAITGGLEEFTKEIILTGKW
ncbi:MAG: hypothetical protein Q8O97_01685, partial [bacterium]|nr:hypothetical protein [bacterium]